MKSLEAVSHEKQVLAGIIAGAISDFLQSNPGIIPGIICEIHVETMPDGQKSSWPEVHISLLF